MPDLEVTIGGRSFSVACQSGEEHFLLSAAQMLDREAQPILAGMGRLPEGKLLLMAGLMLADRTAGLEDELRKLRQEHEALLARPAPPPERVEVPVLPPELGQTLEELALKAETLAAKIETRASAG